MIALPRDVGLDALRATGALLVLFAHGGYFLFPLLPWFDAFVLAGWLGTEVFFALTGFLVMRMLLRRPPRGGRDALRFVGARMIRILPLFWLALALHAGLAMADGRGLPADAWRYAVLAQNLAWTHPAFFGEAWNLPGIVLFSVVAPGLVLAASMSRGNRFIVGVLVVAILVAMLVRWTWVLDTAPLWDEGVRKIVAGRLDACLYGALAACVVAWSGMDESPREALRAHGSPDVRAAAQHSIRPLSSSGAAAALKGLPEAWWRGRGIATSTAVCALATALALFFVLPRDASVTARIATFIASGIAMAAACVALSGAIASGNSGSRRAAYALARWSYALYLINMPMLFVFALCGFGQTLDPVQGALRFALWLLLSISAAAALHRWMERPLLVASRRWRDRGASPATIR